MIDTKIKFDLDTEKVTRKLAVLSNGFIEVGEIFADMANSLCEIDTDGRDTGETDCSVRKETKND